MNMTVRTGNKVDAEIDGTRMRVAFYNSNNQSLNQRSGQRPNLRKWNSLGRRQIQRNNTRGNQRSDNNSFRNFRRN